MGSPITSESGEIGSFTIYRNGGNGIALPVSLSMGGSAENGKDYETIPSSTVIPAGQDSVEIPVVPIPDDEAEETETVTMKILPSETYTIAEPETSIVRVEDSGHTPRFRPTQMVLQPDGTMMFVVETPKTGSYTLEASDDLKQWNILEVITSSAPTVNFKDTSAKFGQRFYRVRFTGI